MNYQSCASMAYSDTAAQQRADKGPVVGTGSEGGDND